MIFNSRPAPIVGDVRPENGFALLPKIVNVQHSVWLQRYSRELMYFKPMNLPGEWIHERWLVYDREHNMVYDPNARRGWIRASVAPTFEGRPPKPTGNFGSTQEAPESQNEASKATSGANRQNFISK